MDGTLSLLKILVEELVDSEIDKSIESFDIKALDSQPNPDAKVAYAQKTLPFIDKGSSRSVFILSDKEVLKVARNRAGVAQNEAESKLSNDGKASNFVAKVFGHGGGYSWLRSERVTPLTSFDEFKELAGIPFKTYVEMIDEWLNSPAPNEGKFLNTGINRLENALKTDRRVLKDPKLFFQTKQRLENYKLAWKSPFLRAMMGLVNRELSVGDVARISKSGTTLKHYGRTWDNRIVLLDYGFTHSVADVYYGNDGRVVTSASETPPEQSPVFA